MLIRSKIYIKTLAYKIKTQSGPCIQIKSNQNLVNKNKKQLGPLKCNRVPGRGSPVRALRHWPWGVSVLAVGRSGWGEEVAGGCVEHLGGSQPAGASSSRGAPAGPFRLWVAVHARAHGMRQGRSSARLGLEPEPAGTMSGSGRALHARD
jgi:hypothetical protein